MRLLIPLILVILFGCSSAPVRGVVTAKDFKPRHDFMVVTPIVISDGKNTTTTMIPVWYHEPDRWTLTIEPYDANGDPLSVRKLMVRKEVYDEVKVGDWYTNSAENIDSTRSRKIAKE